MSFLRQFNEKQLLAYKNHWKQFLLFGIALVILGSIAISAATMTTLLSVVFLGIIIFLSGCVIVFDTFTFWWGKWNGFFVHALVAILYLTIGFMLIRSPVESSATLTLLLGVFYIIAGVLRIIYTSLLKTPRWGWGWFNGLVTLVLGILILTSWPASGLLIIGLFVGIDLVFCGLAYIMSALAVRKL